MTKQISAARAKRSFSQKIPQALLLSLGGLAGILGTVFFLSHLQDVPKNTVWTALGENPGDSFGTKVAPAGDVNGDGFADAAVWSNGYQRNTGKIYVYLGSAKGLSRSPSWSTPGESKGDEYGHSFGGVGDVNGDGFGDFIVAAQGFGPAERSGMGKAYLYLGSTQGLSPAPFWTLTGHAPGELFGDCSGPAGDIDQDGLGDVIVGAYGYDHNRGSAYLFHGSKEKGLSPDHFWKGEGQDAGDWFGYSVSSAGDVNHDGFRDLIIGAKMAHKGKLTHVGKVYVYYGSKKGFSPGPSWSAQGEKSQDLFGWRAITAGDLNGDGFGDVVVSAYAYSGSEGSNSGKVYVYSGSSKGLSRDPVWSVAGEAAGALFGSTIASGDFNQDGYSDIVVGSPSLQHQKGKIYLFLGSSQGLSRIPSWSHEGEKDEDHFGNYVANAGDVNGDGFPDLLVGAPYGSDPGQEGKPGKAYLFYGGKDGKLSSTPPKK